MFVATANTYNIPRPLLDRLEVIRIPGYTEDEKVHIAKRHLIPSAMKATASRKTNGRSSDDALRDIIRYYTREAGVRNMEREIANLDRKAVKEILPKSRNRSRHFSNIGQFLGVPKFASARPRRKIWSAWCTGLAWTEVGGELLVVEALPCPAKAK